jgi:4a-hydroxytetrahydrobiopterin dehydratase
VTTIVLGNKLVARAADLSPRTTKESPMADTALSAEEVQARMVEVPGWELIDGKLHREFTFADFSEAFAFMTRVALLAEKLDHHPDWSNSWNKVTIGVSSHAAGGITARCFELAAGANRFAGG